jgi:hypothetical protein
MCYEFGAPVGNLPERPSQIAYQFRGNAREAPRARAPEDVFGERDCFGVAKNLNGFAGMSTPSKKPFHKSLKWYPPRWIMLS